MATNSFPGVYTTVIDNSAYSTSTSKFRCALVGVANKGVLNVPTPVTSIQSFKNAFGTPIDGTYLADAVANVAKYSDGAYVVRVASTYKTLATTQDLVNGPFSWTREGGIMYIDDVTGPFTDADNGKIWIRVYNGPAGAAATDYAATYDSQKLLIDLPDTAPGGHSGNGLTFYYLYTIVDTNLAVQVSPGEYVQLSQPGLATTTGLKVVTTDDTTGRIQFVRAPISNEASSAGVVDPSAVAIAAPYAAATVKVSRYADAASNAEAIIQGSVWGSTLSHITASGVLNGYELQLTATGVTLAEALAGANISAGTTIIRVNEPGKNTTYEALVKSIDRTGKITLQSTSRVDTGFQPVALADNYTLATIQVRSGFTPAVHLQASTPGTWANTDTANSTGLTVKIVPGTSAGTKRLKVYEDSNLVNDFDNLSVDPSSAYYWPTVVNVDSSAVTVVNLPTVQPANTSIPWSRAAATINNPSFTGGENGATLGTDDIIGTATGDDNVTGLQSLTYPQDLPTFHVIAVPGCTDLIVARELANIAETYNRMAIFDSPRGYNLREATAWHDAQLVANSDSTSYSKIDSKYLSFYWNWVLVTSPFTAEQKYVPPTVLVAARMARNFDQYNPYWAHAGMTRGLLPEALGVEFPKVSTNALEASYGNGNCINSILTMQGSIVIWGNRTASRSETKMSAINNVMLVNECLNQMSTIARGYVFEPNDDTLLTQLKTDFDNALTAIKNNRGMDDYSLVMDSSNNTAATRNNRTVNVALSVIPTDAAERINIVCSVNSSGATLTSAA